MSQSSESRKSGYKDSDDPNIIQLGLSVSVDRNSASDFEIYVNDKKQTCRQLTSSALEMLPSTNLTVHQNMTLLESEREKSIEQCTNHHESLDSRRETYGDRNDFVDTYREISKKEGGREVLEDLTIVDEIKNAMGNFEKFSEHVREIPRLSKKHIYTSTPYPEKNNSRSEGNLSSYLCTSRPRIPKYDFMDGKYYRNMKPLPRDLFLKPLPGEDYFRKGCYRRYHDAESYAHFTSVDNIPNYCEFGSDYRRSLKRENDKSDALSSASDICSSEVKISQPAKKGNGTEMIDKQSISSESAKDIKIYQSGGILIMQNFNESTDLVEMKDWSESTKLIENSKKLKEKMISRFQSSDESQNMLLNGSSEGQTRGTTGKLVQFDLSSCENSRSKSCESSCELQNKDYIHTVKSESTNSKTDISKRRENARIISQSQDFASISTQENDSITSNALGISPTSSTCDKKLEWDNGADVGYLSMDLTKENISTIERIVLRGLSDDGMTKKNVIYEKATHDSFLRPSKFALERMPSDLAVAEICENEMKRNSKKINLDGNHIPSSSANSKHANKQDDLLPGNSKMKDKGVGVNFEELDSDPNERTGSMYSAAVPNTIDGYIDAKLSTLDACLEQLQKQLLNPSNVDPAAVEKSIQTANAENELAPSSSDKSIYVNTLFGDLYYQLQLENISRSEESCQSESSVEDCKISPRFRNFRKKKGISQETTLTSRLKDKVDSIIDIASHAGRSVGKIKEEMIDLEVHVQQFIPEMKDFTVSQKQKDKNVEEVSKIASQSPRSDGLMCLSSKDQNVEAESQHASSVSIFNVMPHAESNTAKNGKNTKAKNFSDQMIQTTELEYQSKSIQALESLKSSRIGNVCDVLKSDIAPYVCEVEIVEDDSHKLVTSCSKSIQASGMNFSLPMHLAHPRQSVIPERSNTKSTQFFGGSVTSLPNFHSSTTANVAAAKVKVLRSKLSSEIENNRIKQENKKNVKKFYGEVKESMLNSEITNLKSSDDYEDAYKKKMDKVIRRNKDIENKENLSAHPGTEKKQTENEKTNVDQSQKESMELRYNGSKKSDSVAFGSCEVELSEDGKNMYLTSDLLKEFGDSIDRDIIQEKYFQSQFYELGKREMITRSTSMERKFDRERDTQTNFSPKFGISVSCQYSPHLFGQTGEVKCNVQSEEEDEKSRRKGTDQGSNHGWQKKSGRGDKERSSSVKSPIGNKGLALEESLSSSTRSAHSWVPGIQPHVYNQNLATGRALSFEYLPGNVFEDTANFREKTHVSVDGNRHCRGLVHSNESNSTPPSYNPVKKSESEDTIVLENTDILVDSDRIKMLDNNLTELEVVVSKLHEKEAMFKKMTDSVLTNITKASGSGDSSPSRDSMSETKHGSLETEEVCCEAEIFEDSNETKNESSVEKQKNGRTHEISIACQTDTLSDLKNLYEERLQLEQRVNNVKEQQIRRIENEIKDLNMLRSLLENQEDLKNSIRRRKRHHYLTEANEELGLSGSLKESILRRVMADFFSLSGTSVDNSGVGNQLKNDESPSSVKLTETSAMESVKELVGLPERASNYTQFGIALSLQKANNIQNVTMLPVGVQVTLKEKKNCPEVNSSFERKSYTSSGRSSSSSSSTRRRTSLTDKAGPSERNVQSNAFNDSGDVETLDKTNLRCKCIKCNQTKCICLKSSEGNADKRKYSRCSSRSGTIDIADSSNRKSSPHHLGSRTSNFSTSKTNDPTDHRSVSGILTSKSDTGYLREMPVKPSSPVHTGIANMVDGAVNNCVCNCHAEALPRCGLCNLLITCQKCQCYIKIKCCLCENETSGGTFQRGRKYVQLKTCCKDATCEMCQCLENEICSICSCHTKSTPNSHRRGSVLCKCKRLYQERSSQTEPKSCKCCECKERLKSESELYRDTKYMSEKQHITENRQPNSLYVLSETKYEEEIKKPVEEKFPFQLKVPIESKRATTAANDATQLRNRTESKSSSNQKQVDMQKLIPKCRCKSRSPQRKCAEGHPRQYFLQIEETSEEESSESCDNTNSLEVITIRVPIRKSSKIGKNSSLSVNGIMRSPKKDIRFKKETPNEPECFCCEDCIGNNTKSFEIFEEPRTSYGSYTSHREQSVGNRNSSQNKEPVCKCCKYRVGHRKSHVDKEGEYEAESLEISDRCNSEKLRPNFEASWTESSEDVGESNCNCCDECSGKTTKPDPSSLYSSNEVQCRNVESQVSDGCRCCKDCPGQRVVPELRNQNGTSAKGNQRMRSEHGQVKVRKSEPEKREKKKCKTSKTRKEMTPKLSRKSVPVRKVCHQTAEAKQKDTQGNVAQQEKGNDKCTNSEYYNFNKKEYMTKSELEREERKKQPSKLSLQECLTVKRPDLYTRAECRRKIISEKTRDRIDRHTKRLECLRKLMPQCEIPESLTAGLKLFTSREMKAQTKKLHKKLPEVVDKAALEKKKVEFRTNKLLGEIFAKKLQLQTLKGHLNLSSSFTVMSTM